MTVVTLVTGSRASEREAAIAAAIAPELDTALILEGLPDGSGISNFLDCHPRVRSVRIAPGCICCTGNLTMRVTLNRLLRKPPARLYISLATHAHMERIRQFLAAAPYDRILTLTDPMYA